VQPWGSLSQSQFLFATGHSEFLTSYVRRGIEAVLTTGGSSLTSHIALSLLIGFAFMLVLEQYFTPHETSTTSSKPQPVFEMPPLAGETMDYDQDRLDVEASPTLIASAEAGDKPRPPVQTIAYPLTLGLVVHSLADGLALGASASGESGTDTSLSLVVFIALIIHKCSLLSQNFFA
jgi:solute carrier family 39 (zinc transporter), member 9